MGNSSSSRRRRNGGQPPQTATVTVTVPPPAPFVALPPPPYLIPPGSGPPGYYHHQTGAPQPYYPGPQPPAHYYQPHGWYPPPPPPPPPPPARISYWSHPPGPGPWQQQQQQPPLPVAVEQQSTATIRNSVNVKKATIRLEDDPDHPHFLLATFLFDATTPGSISVFLFAKEGPSCSLTCVDPSLYKPVKVPFDKGFGQVFKQASGTGFNLSHVDTKDLALVEGHDEMIPLVIRVETVSEDDASLNTTREEIDTVGGPLPKWINSQITNAAIEKKNDGDYKVRVLSQIIWVDGVRYELQEIYGIESSTAGSGISDDDFGKECVICMSEPRDTTVLPCRHMCMCKGCANIVRFQMDRCPICRQRVEKLLEIKVS